MPEAHRAQLHLCHERIVGSRTAGGHEVTPRPWCNLSAWAWCYDCDHYVCDIHANARHEGHRLVVEFPDKAPRPGSRLFRVT